mmetsp:Transcript_167973/g.534226  ORF Transcript_167973/g.534226 Transcript_167973/m.534226 type:complete len:159 (-) Transcript_167973:109-585(-)
MPAAFIRDWWPYKSWKQVYWDNCVLEPEKILPAGNGDPYGLPAKGTGVSGAEPDKVAHHIGDDCAHDLAMDISRPETHARGRGRKRKVGRRTPQEFTGEGIAAEQDVLDNAELELADSTQHRGAEEPLEANNVHCAVQGTGWQGSPHRPLLSPERFAA